MSGHFHYEIDEKKLRVRLLDHEKSVDAEAWSKFEKYFEF